MIIDRGEPGMKRVNKILTPLRMKKRKDKVLSVG